MITKLLDRLNALADHPMNEALTEKITSVTRIIDYPKKAFLLRDGEVCDQACMVVKGLARAYYINEERDITSRFMDDKTLEDKAKSAQAIELINSFDMGKDFNYGERAMKEDKGRLKDVKTPDRYKGLLD